MTGSEVATIGRVIIDSRPVYRNTQRDGALRRPSVNWEIGSFR